MNNRFAKVLMVVLAALTVSAAYAQERTEIFISKDPYSVHYRIPALAALPDGSLICVADYRFSGQDIGVVKDGRVDLRVRTSDDNGYSWGEITTLAEGRGKDSPDFLNVAFGDPCVVADRRSGRILVMSCAGNISFVEGTNETHLRIVRFYSEDGGKTWTAPEDITDQLYAGFEKCSYGPAKSMFVTSGRITQSRYVKAGKYYRLYCAVLQAAGNGEWKNYVLYSDDFGQNWNVLGGAETAPIPVEANEAKVEELADGSVLITSRTDAEGRNLNIFRYTDRKKSEGSWGKMAHSSAHNNGIVTEKNSCNGELMVMPVVRKSDGRRMELLMQSVPVGPKRSNVGIYFKALELDKAYTTEEIAADWDGVFNLTRIGSAYSVMAWQTNGKLGVAYEEKTYYPNSGCGYTIVYDCFDVEEVTGGKYTLDTRRQRKNNKIYGR